MPARPTTEPEKGQTVTLDDGRKVVVTQVCPGSKTFFFRSGGSKVTHTSMSCIVKTVS